VRFADAARLLFRQGRRVFVEIGPHSTLLGMLCHIVPEREVICAPSLRRDQGDWPVLLRSLGELFVAGVTVDWAGVYRGAASQRLALPTYPFQRERYWIDPEPARTHAAAPFERDASLLGRQLRSPAIGDLVFESEIGLERLAFLDHHRIHGALLMPSPAYLEMARAAANEAFGPGDHAVEAFAIDEPMVLPERGSRLVQTVVGTAENGRAPMHIYSSEVGAEHWTLHVTARLATAAAATNDVIDVAAIQSRCPEQIDGEAYYQLLRTLGLEFGADFRGLERIWRREGEALASVVLPERLDPDRGEYGIHPALLDACFHALGAPLPARDEPVSYLLIGIDRFQLHRSPTRRLWNHVVLRAGFDRGGQMFSGDVALYDEGGRLVAEAEGVLLKLAGPDALRRAAGQHASEWFYDVTWQFHPRREGDDGAGLASMADRLRTTARALADQHGLEVYRSAVPALDDLALSYAAGAMRSLGWAPGDDRTAAEYGTAARHARLAKQLLAQLAEAIDRPEVTATATVDELNARAVALAARYPAIRAEVDLTRRCGARLADVLRDRCDPLQLLFPNGSLAAIEPIYAESPSAKAHNALVAEAAGALATRPEGRPLRVLEIGAGSGATTAAVQAVLPPGRFDYWSTDVSSVFLSRARDRFGDAQSMHFALLDIERDPLAQGFSPGQFDLVIAANVVHATADLRQTLAHIRSVLAPGGALVLLEGASRHQWVDITFGLTEGWWKFADPDLRPHGPLLSATRWPDVLTSLGFSQVTTVAAGLGGRGEPSQVVVIARAPLAGDTPGVADGGAEEWLIFADADGLGDALAARVRAGGSTARTVTRGPYSLAPSAASVDPTSPDDLARLLRESQPSAHRRVVFLWGLDASPGDSSAAGDGGTGQEPACLEALALTRELAGSLAGGQRASLWLVTRGAQPVNGIAPNPSHAPLWGLGRVIALEHPDVWGGLVDLEPGSVPAEDARRVVAEVAHPDGEDQIAWRGHERYVARLTRRQAPEPRPIHWRPGGAYLITGGLGGLGLKLAQWMANQGARHIALVSRHGLPDRAEWTHLAPGSRAATQVAAIEAIEATGAAVHVFAVDVGDRALLASLIDRFGASLPPLRGIVHAAADLSAWTIADMPPEALRVMMRSKATGAWLLHELTAGIPLDFFVLFSSTTGVWGSRSMAHYAAANHVLDILAHHRRAIGRPALSIDWGTWDEMRIASAEERERVANFGLRPMPSEDALAILSNLMGNRDIAQIVVADVDWERLKPAYEARRPMPLLSQIDMRPRARATASRNLRSDPPELLRRLETMQPSDRPAAVLDHVRMAVARTLNLDANRPIDTRQGLFDMGMDSLMSVELKGRLEASVGRELPSTLTFNYPSIEALAGYLCDEILGLSTTSHEHGGPSVAPESSVAVASGVDVDDGLSEDELAALLSAKLARLQ
jgi:acyl transferase domain-containing protein/acyl carrier protein